MKLFEMMPPGRLPHDQIDAMLARTAPDEWLPGALLAPLQVGLIACAAALIALTIQFALPQWLPAAIALWAVWCAPLPLSVGHMIRLRQIRLDEALVSQKVIRGSNVVKIRRANINLE